MAYSQEDIDAIKRRLQVTTGPQLIEHARNAQMDLANSKAGSNEASYYMSKLQILLNEIDARSLPNPLRTPDPVAPPPIPGVVIPPQARAPQPPPSQGQQPARGGATGLGRTSRGATQVGGNTYPIKSGPIVAVGSNDPDPALLAVPSADRKCRNCPNYMRATDTEEQVNVFGKAIGIPMCKRLRIPLSTLNSNHDQADNIQIELAKRCKEWAIPDHPNTPVQNADRVGRIAVVDVGLSKKSEALLNSGVCIPPRACSGCAFFKSSDVMINELGIPHDTCALNGVLIPFGKGKETASACNSGVENFNDEHLDDFKWTVIDPYNGNIDIDESITTQPSNSGPKALHPDPNKYKTDKPVTAEDEAHGIRAWRKLSDPARGSNKFVFMPIFDPASFDDSERSKIPSAGQTPDDDHPELYEDHFGLLYTVVVLWTQLHETPALNGVAGTGKTEFFRYAAWSMQLPFERFSITNSTELDELQGRMALVSTENGNKTEFVYGRVSLAWGKRCILAIDEPNTGPNDVWQFFRPLTDNSKQLVLDVNNGERLQRNKYCLMGMAFNPSWDMRNVGTHEISDADGSRLMHIAVEMPTEEQERNIIKRRCELDGYKIPTSTLEAIMKIAEELRKLSADNAFPVHWGIRNQLKVARATAWFEMKAAYRLAAGDLLEPDFRDQLLVMVDSYAPKENRVQAKATSRGSIRARRA